MKTSRRNSHEQSMFWTVLVLLVVLALMVWVNGACHEPLGQSRIDWPRSAPVKP